ncbi:adenylate kinase [candidate division WOR-1 bacterium RIFOXYB2_FULL_48_7]|uniref:Adenylate kinase n=1 Tax=candidate division WOR-1 bacterium RIFOXYB2_FULL_48_7 TaxID=1802583 RepID=A0A1F4TS48_UNCSA|nr:MAG: adenylate kinase [candidate division WOR-1 bacterium RIFOXYB2_FULL_48_7]
MILIFLGPPGSGKGTQAKMLAEKTKIPHISVGDILRDEVRKGSDLGKQAKEHMEAGRLVPDELTIELTRQRIGQADCIRGFIMDGFPRSLKQAVAFDKMLEEQKKNLDAVVYFNISDEEVIERLSGRRSCKNCGAVYHLKNLPPKVEGICDVCGGELYLRKDDEESVIRTRFEVYAKSTQPLIDHYSKMGKIIEIDAAKPIEEITAEMLKITAIATVL